MSAEGSAGKPRQVWLPGSGVWAAVPAGKPERQRPDRKTREKLSGERGSGERRGRRGTAEQSLAEPAYTAVEVTPLAGAATGTAAAAPSQHQRAVQQPAPPPHYTGFELQHSDHEASDVEEVEPPPTCPICLTDIIELSDKAVVTACMHTFCHDCITRWLSHHKRFCPLCKARVSSVLYDITPGGTYKEREVPASPKQATAGSGQAGGEEAGLPLLQRLQDFLGVAGLLDPYEQQQLQQARGGTGSRGLRLRTEAGSGRVGYGGAARQHAGPGDGQQQAARHAGGAAGASGAQQGPRPYFWRLQQRLQAGAYRPGAGGAGGSADGDLLAEGPVSEEDYVLLWRRQIYDQGLWAVPLGSEPARISLGSGSARERRLTEWIDRELRALLQTDDTTIVRGFVLGLLVAYGLDPFPSLGGSGDSSTGAGSRGSAGGAAAAAAAAAASRRAADMVAAARHSSVAGGGGGSSSFGAASRSGTSRPGAGAGAAALGSSPVEALQPFLHDHSAHFWHELRCFATAPFNLSTYDRMVQYLRRQPEAGPLRGPPAAPAVGAGSGSGGAGRASRWDQRQQPGAALGAPRGPPAAAHPPVFSVQQRQQQWGSRAVQPARVVLQASRAEQQQRRQQQQQAADAEVPRQQAQHSGGGGGGSSSRNPSPPRLPVPRLRAAACSLAAAAAVPCRQATLGAAHTGVPQSAKRPRSSSRSRSPDRRRQHRGRSPSRSSSRSRSRTRSSSRSRSRHRSSRRTRRLSPPRPRRRRGRSRSRDRRDRGRHDRSGSGSWRRGRSAQHERRDGREFHPPYSSSSGRWGLPQAYLVGDDDAGDRWGMG